MYAFRDGRSGLKPPQTRRFNFLLHPFSLVGMAQARFPDYFADEQHLISLCERIHVLKVDTSAGLLSALRALEDQILDSAVKLIALDSAASLLRKV